MKNKIKVLIIAAICAVLSVAVGMITFAGNWFGGLEWDHEYGGAIACRWEKCEGASRYILTVTKGTSGSVIYGPQDMSGNYKDVTNAIVKKGTGSYYFDVVAYADQGSEYEILGEYSSDVLEIDSTELKAIKSAISTEQNAIASTDGWHSYPQNNWTYGKGNNTLAKNEWLTIDGKIYHFDNKGYMQKGWQQIGGKYYYFDTTNGNLWVNAVTPDGYTVNAEGVWVDGNGAAVSGAPVNATIAIKLTEGNEVGVIKTAQVTGVSNANLVSWSFGTPYESWQVGSPVKLTVVVSSGNGFQFNKNTKFTCSNATVNSFSGTNPATVDITYYPKMKLSTPTNLSLDSSNILRWIAVKNARSYSVRIYDSGSKIKTFTVGTTSVDISEYLDEYTDISVGVVAMYNPEDHSTKTAKYYINSDEAKLNDVMGAIADEKVTDGQFVNASGSISYRDESGERVTGWQKIAGSWYYFDKKGVAVGPGWWQDADGNWYYFSNEHKMMVGNINDGKADYFMNDGSNPNFPYGAWVH